MSNQPGQPPVSENAVPTNPSVRYEARDVNTKAVFISLVALGGIVLLASLLLWPLYEFLSTRPTESSSSVSPFLQEEQKREPPEPRLQGGPGHEIPPQEEMRQMRTEAEAILNSYGWVDRQAGIARIPIEQAMKLLAERSPSATNPAETTGNARSDLSRAPVQ